MQQTIEDALRESEANLKAIIENSIESIWSIDTNYQIMYVNEVFAKAFEASFGVALKKGVNLIDSLPDALKPLWKERYDRTINNEHFIFLDKIDIIEPAIYIEVAMNPIVVDGKVVGASFYGKDISKQKNYELQLLEAKEKAEESDRLKTAFLQNMSHEIRTPMNAIMGFSSLLSENFGNVNQLEKFSQIINQRCSDLLCIINDILDISKIESGQSPLHIEVCNLNELFSELSLFFIDYQRKINKSHIELIMSKIIDQNIVKINTDILKVKQILINLITNAFKYSESGQIECTCMLENNKLLFSISDTGVGIPNDKHDYIFERFSQLKNAMQQNIGGTGLGLPIVKGLVGLLGGSVWLKSECNKGTTFFFTIDYNKAITANMPISTAVNQTQDFVMDKSVLIVEDDNFNAMYLEEVLKNSISNLFIVGKGLDAVKFIQNNSVDIVLMDVQLPDINGYEATKMILQEKPNMKIIAQTAYAANDERHKAQEAGCVDYISKPTKQNDLLKLLRKYL